MSKVPVIVVINLDLVDIISFELLYITCEAP